MKEPILRVYNGLFEIETDDLDEVFDEVLAADFNSYLRYTKPDDPDSLIFNVFFLKNPPPGFRDLLFSYVVDLKRDGFDIEVKMTFYDDLDIREDAVYNLITCSSKGF